MRTSRISIECALNNASRSLASRREQDGALKTSSARSYLKNGTWRHSISIHKLGCDCQLLIPVLRPLKIAPLSG